MPYNYGPPPPPPPSAGPGSYPSYGPRGGHSGRGRTGSDRGGYHQPQPGYSYGQQPTYGPQTPAPYPSPPQPGYPQLPHQAWHSEHSQQHPPQGGPHAPLPVQNYHPNYAPQVYHQQPPYGGQPQYPPAPQPPYGQPYPGPAPQPGPPVQQWGAPSQPHPVPGAYGGGGRGGRSGYNDRSGPKGQLMGPPIRIGFDGNSSPPTAAPVSTPYPYGGPPAPPAPYPAPYQGYPPPAPYMPPAPPFDAHSGRGPRQHGRGGFHHSKPRHLGGDKSRSRNQNQNKGPSAQTPPIQHQKPDAASAGKKKKRKTNTLGLTPGDDSDEDDENEEERLNEMIGAEAPNPKTSSEIAAWIAERRARFPTKAKIEAAKAAAKAQNGDAHDARDSALEKRAEKLRKQLEKVESSIKRKREQQDEGDDMRDVDLSSSPSSDVNSDDEKPEVLSARHEPSNVPPPPRKADPTKHCKYYSTGGTCGKRGKCRFVHDPAVREAALRERELNGGRMTLQQRLILNDNDQEDLAIVETLKYLQDKGVLPKKASGAPMGDQPSDAYTAAHADEHSSPASEGPRNDLPPIPPTNVSTDDHSAKYPGWNLSGFGNTGVGPSE
ncbi:uncharacterized protein B0T15DRAFT_67221 [Chaetomium strumarium]|uniref:C3H1-type domain-containing protein n=1 Tax=Chaetomium strumarium TaxID=1170767 RepID=A0AAJ0H3U8_9PEZI|nr:hypothetical protein B0T15DRAFT_67221 [Chaetomium strumarium]